MITVFYDANAIFINGGRDRIYPAGTLMATASGNTVSIFGLHSEQPIVVDDFSQIGDQNEVAFDTVQSCLTYLNGEFAKRRALDAPVSTSVAGADLYKGVPVTISRANGQLLPARADTYFKSFVIGLSASDTSASFAGNVARNPVIRDDWTAVAGTASLVVGQPYFLGLDGGITLQPSLVTGNACVRVGDAVSNQTLAFRPSDPILL